MGALGEGVVQEKGRNKKSPWGVEGGRSQEQEEPGVKPEASQDKAPGWSRGREKPWCRIGR